MNPNIQIVVFAIYTILYEAIIWGIFGYGVFVTGHSAWWMVLAVFMSSQQLKIESFTVTKEDKE